MVIKVVAANACGKIATGRVGCSSAISSALSSANSSECLTSCTKRALVSSPSSKNIIVTTTYRSLWATTCCIISRASSTQNIHCRKQCQQQQNQNNQNFCPHTKNIYIVEFNGFAAGFAPAGIRTRIIGLKGRDA